MNRPYWRKHPVYCTCVPCSEERPTINKATEDALADWKVIGTARTAADALAEWEDLVRRCGTVEEALAEWESRE